MERYVRKYNESMFNDVIVYDNGGESMDRYTVIIGNDAYGMSDNPTSPQGFNQYIGEVGRDIMLGRHLGKEVRLNRLPKQVIKAVEDRMENSDY